MTIEIGLYEAKTKFSQLVETVQAHGEEVVLTKRGRPVARIVPIPDELSPVEKMCSELLAIRTDSTLITLDQRLRVAADASGVDVLS